MDFKKSDTLKETSNVIDESTPSYYSDVYSPWETKEQLRIWFEVEWSVWNSEVYVLQQNITTTTSIKINKKITNWVKITAYVNWNWNGFTQSIYNKSTWYATWISIAYTWAYVPWVTDLNDNTQVLRLFQFDSSNVIRARIENITWSWFDLNFYMVNYTWYVTVILECF